MAIRTKDEIIDAFETDLESKIPEMDVNNTIVKNVIIDAPAGRLETFYDDLSHTQRIQSLINAGEMTEEELDNYAYSFDLTRLLGVKSSTNIRFLRKSLPSDPIILAESTVIATRRTLDVTSVSFNTLQERTFSNAVGGYDGYDTDKNAYYVEIAIEALEVGEQNNVGSSTIIDIISNIRGIDEVYNPLPATGGIDIEDNTALAARIQAKASGGQLNTKNGYKSLVTDNFILRDVVVIGPTDTEMTRNPYGNAVDIIFIGETLTSKTDSLIYNSANPPTTYYFGNVPVTEDSVEITGIDPTSNLLTLEEGAAYDFEVVKDTSTLKNSNRALDRINFHIRASKVPLDGSALSINYTYNKMVTDIQTIVDLDVNKIVGSDALMKEADKYELTIEADITLLTGYDFDTVKANIIDNITDKLLVYKLGQDLDQSDIVAWIYEVEGVDKVDLDTLVPDDDVEVDQLTYIKLEAITIT